MKEDILPERRPRDVVASRGVNGAEPSKIEESVQVPYKLTLTAEQVKDRLNSINSTVESVERPHAPDFRMSVENVRGQLCIALRNKPEPLEDDDAWAVWAAANPKEAFDFEPLSVPVSL